MSEPINKPLVGMAWMFLTGVLFIGVTAIVKYVGDGLPPAEAAFLRYVIGLVFFIPIIGDFKKVKLSRRDLKLFAFRGIAHSLGVTLWFYAMTSITMAEVTAMSFLTPVFVTVGAAIFLGERFSSVRSFAILISLIGVLIILRPGFRELSLGHVTMILNGIFFAISYLIAKVMADKASPLVVVGMLSIMVTIGLAPLAFLVWVPPTLVQLGWMSLLALVATVGHYTMTLALRAAPISVTQPISFLQLVWSIMIGVFVFMEGFDEWVFIGATLILFSVSFIMWREAHVRRRIITPVALETKL